MGHANGRITAPVNHDDIGETIGSSSRTGKNLAQSDNINPWAKFKPEAQGTYRDITVEQRRLNNFGLEPQATYSKAAFVTAVDNGTFNGGWRYIKLGDNDWARNNDWDGYNSRATSPFGDLLAQEYTIGSASGEVIVNSVAPRNISQELADQQGVITISEFGRNAYSFKDWYLGVYLKNKSTGASYMATIANPIGGSTGEWKVTIANVNAGSYKAVPFLSSVPITSLAHNPSGCTIAGILNAGVDFTVKSVSDSYVTSVNCIHETIGGTEIRYTVGITNTTAQAHTFAGVTLQVAKTSTGGSAKTLASFGSKTVAANGKWTTSGTADAGAADYAYARLTYTGDAGEKWTPVMSAPMLQPGGGGNFGQIVTP